MAISGAAARMEGRRGGGKQEAEGRKGFLLQWLLSPIAYLCLPLTKPEFHTMDNTA